MIYAIYAAFTMLGIFLITRIWLKGEDFKRDANSFSVFICLTVIEGLMLFTTIIPPSAGLFAGVLFGFWLWVHILSGRAILQEKITKNEKMPVSIIVNFVFFILVTISYFGG
ncbi:membrane protein [Salmonella phage SPLA5a]|nr:membrane protein [Salmonella phage SPLA5a]